jgi:nitrogen fixation NifU-like protein
MSDLRDLYQEIILDHNRRPRNYRCPADANRQAHGDNPLCGDRVTVYLTVQDGIVKDVGFQGRGCAISMASASLMTEMLKGRTEAEARALFKRFHRTMTGEALPGEDDPETDRLAVFSGVREYPMRVKCATLSWHTLLAALNRDDHPVSTETADGL